MQKKSAPKDKGKAKSDDEDDSEPAVAKPKPKPKKAPAKKAAAKKAAVEVAVSFPYRSIILADLALFPSRMMMTKSSLFRRPPLPYVFPSWRDQRLHLTLLLQKKEAAPIKPKPKPKPKGHDKNVPAASTSTPAPTSSAPGSAPKAMFSIFNSLKKRPSDVNAAASGSGSSPKRTKTVVYVSIPPLTVRPPLHCRGRPALTLLSPAGPTKEISRPVAR